ncbi:MAG: slipin family protein, partial [Cellvibrionaceae bacterium]|nr:slipin family protein [Cellvibrionaceae bacterium]
GSYKIANPGLVATKLNDYASFIYRELQLRLREAVGTQSLDALLADKDSLNEVIVAGVRGRLAEFGIEAISIGVKDIVLPGDMKTILNQVVEAQKESEANLIKRREETQAMRSLHNTAKMMENNPILLRLKELEALERVTARIDKISVYGGLDGVLNDLVKLSKPT